MHRHSTPSSGSPRWRRALILAFASSLAHAGSARADRPEAGSVTPERLKLPSGPSSVRGLADEPRVDAFDAQLDYQVPLELPNGRGGLTPKLALTYSGSLGNGPVGIGWSLSHAQIRRSTRLGVPRFDDSVDELEIVGIASGRLVAIGNGEYRVEGRGQTVRVKQVPGGGFDVDDGTGQHYRLGTSAMSRQEAGGRTLTWFVESETNQVGEQIAFTYTHDRNQVYLARIAWGPGAVYGVAFDYATRNDPSTSYRGGFAIVTARRLQTITLTAFGIERRAYHLSYDPPAGDPTFPLARLSSVTSTGENALGAWPTLSFVYAAPAPATAAEPIAGAGAWRLNQNGTTLVDLDGDGAADLLQAQGGGHSYRLNQNGTFGTAVPISGNTQSLAVLQLQDVDGDARPELLQDGSDGWSVWRWSKSKWLLQPGSWPGSKGLALKDPTSTRFADLNGDGLVDALTWNSDGLNVFLATRTGIAPSYAVGLIGGGAGGGVTPAIGGRFQDVNGDGLDDYVVVALDHLDMYIGHGDGTFEPRAAVAFPFPGTITDTSDIELADLDRDGLLDLIKIETGQVRWFQGQTDGTFSTAAKLIANPETLSPTVTVAVADSNGNGSHDIVWSSAAGMWRMDLAGATTAGMLIRVKNGLGLDTTFDYQSSHALEVADSHTSNAWTSLVPIAIPVPVRKTTALGAGETTRIVTYAVRNGFWDATEQRFGGFLTTVVTTFGATPAATSSVTTTYNKGTGIDREKRGTITLERVRDGTGKLISDTSNTWATMAVSGLPDTPLLRRAILQEASVDYTEGPAVHTTDVKYTYDGFGRAVHVVDLGRTDLVGDESVQDTSYADDAVTWVRDRVCEQKLSGSDGALVSDVQHLFGDDQAEQPLCVVGKGWPRRTLAWLGSEARWITQEATSYDANANPTSVTEHGVERRWVWDPTGLFPIEEHVTAPSGRELVWTATWDQVLGVVTAVLDPDGHTTHSSYDSLGRFTGLSVDDHPAHQVVEYDWTPPFPKTTTWEFDGALADVTERPAQWSAASHWRQSVEVANGKGQIRYHAVRLADAQWIISDYREVDPNERVVFAGRPVLASQLELAQRPAGAVGDTLVYDPLGRLIEQDLPNGATRTFSSVAFERTARDVDLAPVHSVLDGHGRAILTERSLPDGTHEVVQASYDPAGRVTQMTLDGTVTRQFSYDTLGRLTRSQDPDLGARVMTWDDGDRLLTETNAAGQAIHYGYDSLGRLATRDAGALFTYHYDDVRPGASGPLANLAGRLAYVDEPTGGVDVGYDELGRTTFTRRTIDDQTSELTTTLATSGVALGRRFDDGFAITYAYDPAGRIVGAGDLWTVLDQDAAGAVLHERTQTGVDTRYERDVLGLPARVTVTDHDGTALYDARATRNLASEITAIADLDGVGLDHGATFSYDGFSRLTAATIGTGAQAYSFGYGYDVLHNMTSRSAAGPSALGAFTGTYRYGETGRAPRQLTSITDAAGQVTHSFDYDAAGREVRADGRTLTFDAGDRVLRVDGVAGGAVTHAYGHDGARIKTTEPDGSVTYLFGDGTTLRGGVRVHDVTIGERVIARIAMTPAEGDGPGGPAGGMLGGTSRWLLGLIALAFAFAVRSLPRARRRRALVVAALGASITACSGPTLGRHGAATTVPVATFMHSAFAAGPIVFTDGTGSLVEERRYEPFGQPIGGPPEIATRDLNELGKRTDAATGWSDHGARWLAPETARWLSPDPPVAAPDADFMAAPWALHPYQYVNQDPIAYWDPDGREPSATYTVQVRRYAAPPTFAGGYIGDNRGPSSKVNASHRTGLNITFNADTHKVLGVGGSTSGSGEGSWFVWTVDRVAQSSRHVLNRDLPTGGTALALVDAEARQVGAGIVGSSAGHDPLLGSPDIDTQVSFVTMRTATSLYVTGTLSGDTFPSADIVISDGAGNSALIGYFDTPHWAGTGPYLFLWGEGTDRLTTFSAEIPLDGNGNFAGAAKVTNTQEEPMEIDYNGAAPGF